MRKPWLISRRTCLHGVGAALGLPLLEAMGWAETPAGGAVKPPVRLGYMYHPCGVYMPDFWPSDPSTFTVTLSKNLEPLRGVAGECLLLDGLGGPENGKPYAPHTRELAAWLTAWLPNHDRLADMDIAPSADQVAAARIGQYTVVPSLELGWRDNAASGLGEQGTNNRYYTTGNYRTATQPLPVETNPANVFKRLFSSRQSTPRRRGGPAVDAAAFAANGGAPGEESLDRSMLDLILGGAKDLRGRVGSADQRRLDDYLDTMRSLEQRVTAIERQQAEAAAHARAGGKAPATGASSPPIAVKIPGGALKWSDHVRLMGDLMILAFQTDLTRVCTLIGAHVHSDTYPEIGITDSHHELSHLDNNPEKIAKVTRIDHLAVEQFAYIVGRMHTLKEGAGTLLDNCIMMWGSGMDHGGHEFRRLPTILAGRGGGTIRTGRHVKLKSGTIGDLHTATLARAGVTLPKPFGCGTRLLPELS
ncbi:MAG: DUF1552 domain-containing protein [Planctomycetes bacterium]|nr:DUF1552 domain-containing protein [Planctomycetota bacterium]